ncbi:chitin-inducible gibberellin-responsive protein 2-like [Aristolochia californica]|uniref:chitin-inducible gibberellin-responsive protein 2-like n=1 Tax=Aristolochia californica TaxID=171875 RepID=UPI0035D7B689
MVLVSGEPLQRFGAYMLECLVARLAYSGSSIYKTLKCKEPGSPPHVRITSVDDSQSAYAQGGGLHIVGQRLERVADSCNVPFEFHAAAMPGCEVELVHLHVLPEVAHGFFNKVMFVVPV